MSQFYIFAEIINELETISRKFKTFGKTLTLHLTYENTNTIDLYRIIGEIDKTLNNLFVNILEEVHDNDYIRVSLRNDQLEREIYVPFRKKQFFSTDLLTNEIIKVCQSNEDFLFIGFLELDIIIVKIPNIGGDEKISKSFLNIDKWRKNSNKVVIVKGDGLCLARAIVVSKGFVDGVRGKDWRKLREDVGKIQTSKAIDLCKKANISFERSGVEYNEIQNFQKALGNEYQLIVVSPPKIFIFKGEYNEKQIYIQMINHHCDALLSIKAFLKCNYFCKRCLKGYMNLVSHKCESICKYCFTNEKCNEVYKKNCSICNRFFVSEDCFQNHINNNICRNYRYCKKCKKLYQSNTHNCGLKKCKICKKIVPISLHECFIAPYKKDEIELEDSIPKVFVFYDFETFIQYNEKNESIHRPNICSLEVVCDFCWDKNQKDKIIKYCSFCTGEKKTFSGYETVKLFFEYIFSTLNVKMQRTRKIMNLKNPIKIKVIAHNSRAYDM